MRAWGAKGFSLLESGHNPSREDKSCWVSALETITSHRHESFEGLVQETIVDKGNIKGIIELLGKSHRPVISKRSRVGLGKLKHESLM
jgi:hypothetical protein